MTCFSFDDPLGGAFAAPKVLSSRNWTHVQHEVSPHSGERKLKPGYRASARGALLTLSTQAVGEQEFKLGYLSSRSSAARVALRCVDGCVCSEVQVGASGQKAAGDTTSTTEFTTRHVARATQGKACHVALEMLTDGQPFKLVALHVRSALVGGGGAEA